eukprot:CAMPEP_0184656962 /NCGR_PEP_ID=MMETSP0308-20130426/16875_1 /TAXON_ID=38269 /ORGANISM="Gloeochaete witrockiana, Strain SAG 46.84" /LENGTH=257 /DNA_ID=CAMNT_0027094307 /DNA_START=88 /DNA_END=864 /DNA_ORIENTATION=-
MGYLHDGHLSLVKRSKQECKYTVVSIFVNPTQFAPTDDLSSYPRDVEGDLRKLESVGGVDLVFIPNTEEMYPPGSSTFVKVENCSDILEGDPSRGGRDGFFRGIATVVCKLFNIVDPDIAFFGAKDAQQCVVLSRMVRDLCMRVKIQVMPIVREPDGLAMSSRNAYLTSIERQAAVVLYRSLETAKKLHSDGERDANALRKAVLAVLCAEPLAQVVYVSLADRETLHEVEGLIKKGFLLSMAVRIGKARLIDNWSVG